MSNTTNISKLYNIGEMLLQHYLYVACDNRLYTIKHGEVELVTYGELLKTVYFAFDRTLAVEEAEIVHAYMLERIR